MAVTNNSWYQYPNSTDSENLFQFFGYINNTVEGLFFPIIIMVIWFVAFLGAWGASYGGRSAAARSWVFASFLTSILSIMASIMGFLAPKFMYLSFILLAVGFLWVKLSSPTIE